MNEKNLQSATAVQHDLNNAHGQNQTKFGAEQRLSPRIEANSFLGLPEGRKGTIVNISESGICFEYDGPELKGDILLSTDLLSTKDGLPAKIVWHSPIAGSRARCGVRLALLDKSHRSQLREALFGIIAKNASAFIRDDDKELKGKVESFFNRDVRQFHEDMSALDQEIKKDTINPEAAEKKTATLINELLLKGNNLEKAVNDERSMKKIKQLFREITGCWYYKSPILKMAYDKPQGYPGDYKLFDMIYDKKPVAEKKTLGFYYDNYFLNNGYACAARARKNKMKNILQDLIENSDLKTIKLLNVACGPSREIRELLCDPEVASRKELVFTGLDNDEDSLKFSQSKFKDLPPNFKVRLLKENVLSLFRDKKYYDLIGKQDIIYILGLTEYLPDRIFRNLTKFLFELLNDKGMLVITYKDAAIEFPSLPPEWLCDWAFIKRTKDDLIETTKALGSDKFSLKIEREGTGTIFFLILTKT